MSFLTKAYLVVYNGLQVAGWSYILALSLPHLRDWIQGGGETGKDGHRLLYATVGPALRLFQTAAILEVFHAALGLVRSSAAITAFQVASRVYVTWAILHVVPQAQSCAGFPLLLIAWTVTEIIRYNYYAINLIGINLSFVTWLRYTLFIVLYPIGVTGELWCQYASLDRIGRERIFSLAMPNAWNFVFNYYGVVIALMVSYVPIFPVLYMHMFAQRRKIVGGEGSKKRN